MILLIFYLNARWVNFKNKDCLSHVDFVLLGFVVDAALGIQIAEGTGDVVVGKDADVNMPPEVFEVDGAVFVTGFVSEFGEGLENY
jgi:hypothetical protein